MNDSWISEGHQELLRLREGGPGWGNRPGGAPYVEPTALSALALAASGPTTDAATSRHAVNEAADWLARLQQSDGGVGLAPDIPRPRWTTPLAILVWHLTDRHAGQVRKAIDWLLSQEGTTWRTTSDSPYGHDTRLRGWPWVDNTHSWLEPTALAILALKRSGKKSHARTHEGLELIRDRSIRSGGWNYGNSAVFGADLRPQPAPTGLALLALVGAEDVDSPLVKLACDYLVAVLPGTRAPQSLCFGSLALAAWQRLPADADGWLSAARQTAGRHSNVISQLAYLLLAAGSQALVVLGAKS
jgi:hypothetical protein